MTRRERLEARIQKRLEWAESRERRAQAAQARSDSLMGRDPVTGRADWALVTQPGHIPQRAQANRAQERAWGEQAMAREHREKAAGTAAALEGTIFSDDPDALEQLEAKVARLEAQREEARKVGAWWRKAKKPKAGDAAAWEPLAGAVGITAERVFKYRRDCASEEGFLNRGPVPSYVLSNLGGEIRRARARIEEVKRRQNREERAEAAGGFLLERHPTQDYAQVTFDEYPGREVVTALKEAGFHWSSGSWFGSTSKLPEIVLERERNGGAELAPDTQEPTP